MTINELYDSPEEILSNIQNDEEFQKLVDEKAAINVIRYHHTMILSECMDEWTEYVLKIAHDLLKENKKLDNKIEEQFHDISNYCRGLTHNTLELNSDSSNPEFLFKFDIEKWNSDSTNQTIDKFELSQLRKITFTYTPEEIELFRNNMDIYGITTNGMAQVLKRVPKFYLWRKIITIS